MWDIISSGEQVSLTKCSQSDSNKKQNPGLPFTSWDTMMENSNEEGMVPPKHKVSLPVTEMSLLQRALLVRFQQPGELRMSSVCFPSLINYTPHDNFVCAQSCFSASFRIIAYHLEVPNLLKTEIRMESDFSWGGRTICPGGSNGLYLPHRDILALGLLFLPHVRELCAVFLCRSWPGAQQLGSQTWIAGHVASFLLSARQDLEEGFAELDIEGGIDHRVEGAVHVAQPRCSAVKFWGHVACLAVGIENMGQEERQPADNKGPWVAKESRNWVRNLFILSQMKFHICIFFFYNIPTQRVE